MSTVGPEQKRVAQRALRLRLRPKWVAISLVCLVAVGSLIAWRLASTSKSSPDGLSRAQPSAVQLVSMAHWYQHHLAFQEFSRSTGRFGCVVYPLATRQLPRSWFVAYTQVMCQQCPPSDLGGLTPVAFDLNGSSVISARAANAVSDPGFLEEIKMYFPRPLWNEASDQTISQGDYRLLLAAAYEVAECS